MNTPVSGVIEEAKQSKSGKTMGIKVGGKWYHTKEFHWQGQVGKHVAFVSSYQAIGDGGMTWANDIVFSGSEGAPSQQTPPPRGQHDDGQQTVPVNTTRPDAMSYLPMTSNVVAHAIAAGVITEPSHIRTWAQAAFDAARTVVEGTQKHDDEFGDEIPF